MCLHNLFYTTKTYYESVKLDFNKNEVEYFDMILNVLQEFFNEEYELLKALAIDDLELFSYFVEEEPTMIKHLTGYDLIKKTSEGYEFRMEVIQDYLIKKEKLITRKIKTIEEQWRFLVSERGKLETELREFVQKVLIVKQLDDSAFNAKDYVMKKIHNSRDDRRKYGNSSYLDLFNPDKTNIYFSDLTKLISGEWDSFKNYYEGSQDEFKFHMENINTKGRNDAHAKGKISESDLTQLKLSFDKMNQMLEKYSSDKKEYF